MGASQKNVNASPSPEGSPQKQPPSSLETYPKHLVGKCEDCMQDWLVLTFDLDGAYKCDECLVGEK